MTASFGSVIGDERAKSGDSIDIESPANGDPIAKVFEANVDDADRAVAAAHRSFRDKSWRGMKVRERGRVMLRIANAIRENGDELARLEAQNVGKPISEARDEVALAADCFEYYGGAISKVGGDTRPVNAPGVAMTFREPIGICAIIVPWNFPIAICAWKSAPAIAMGNSIVVKPAEQTPLTAIRLAEIALGAGLPPGVFNVVAGKGSVVGERLVTHPLVRKISFTGSTEVGARVMKLAADDIKRVTLELGGKSANIVFADCDIERAVASASSSALGNAGQDCCARSRLLVEQSTFDDFVSRLESHVSRLRLGDPLDEKTEIGPLVTKSHWQRVSDYVDVGKSEGATLVCGGTKPDDEALRRGTYLRPAIFANANRSMRIAREEIFGPVIIAMPFRDEEDAIEIANATDYGLSGSIWTRDIGRALRVARAVESGVLSINSGSSVHLEMPFGGMKKSGVGRELGLAALDHYSEIKTVYIDTEG